MHAALVGKGWKRQLIASHPTESYSYWRGGVFELNDFIVRNQGKFIIGMLSYDLGYELQGISQTVPQSTSLPDAYFIAFDATVDSKLPASSLQTPLRFRPQITRGQYHQAFEKLQQHIYNGDVYQANLTHQLIANYTGNGEDVFTRIATKNPAAMAAYVKGPDFEIASFSPERFISIQNGHIVSQPIKGTRPSGQEQELLTSEKEQAELNMITDLLRNDIGKVSKIGTVKVTAHRKIMKLPHISHTFSRIEGQLRDDVSPIDALLSMFPGGSITGCPKKRAMEIIDDIEWANRGAYCGCIVTIDEIGNLDSSIAIRTLVKQDSELLLSVGGGIVIDSNEEDEYQETLDKAAAILDALK